MKRIIVFLISYYCLSQLFAQHGLSGAYQRTYTNDNIAVEYSYQFDEKWRMGGGIKWLNSRRFNWNDERSFYQTRRPMNWWQHWGLTANLAYNPFPTSWTVKPWITWNTHFTYAGANFIWIERTGEVVNDAIVVITHHQTLEAFPTIEQHLLLRVEAFFTDHIALQLGAGYGFGFSWGWDPSLEYFKWRHGHRIPVDGRKTYLEWAPFLSIGMSYSLGRN
jgi:hypothetical protein